MHIAVGRWIAEHRAVPFRDPFSFTAPGGLWVPHEWGAEVVIYTVWRFLGWGGVIALAEVCIFAAFAILTHALLSYLEPRRALLGAMSALILAESHLIARPHLLALPLMAFWMAQLISARDSNKTPSYWLLPVMTVWANLHDGFIAGIGFVALLGGEAVIEARNDGRMKAAWAWGVFFVASIVAGLLTPNGIQNFVMTAKLLSSSALMASIDEWQAADFSGYQPLELWIGAFILVAASIGLRLSLTRIAMILVLLHLALSHVRNAELLGFVTPLLLARSFQTQQMSRERLGARFAGVGLALFAGIALAFSNFQPTTAAPVAALDAARKAGLNGRVMNLYNFGGFLILNNVPVFIDGRADLYGDDFMRDYTEMMNRADPETLNAIADRYGIAWTLFEPDALIVRRLDTNPGWQRVYADKFAVVHKRIMNP